MNKLLKFIILLIFAGIISQAFIFIKNINLLDFQSVPKSRELYNLAREYQKKDDYRNAYYAFNKISPNYAAYEAVLFHQAKCAAELEDEKTAILKFNKLLSKYSNNPLAAQASYGLGQAYIRTKNYVKAEKQFLSTIEKYPETDFAIGSYYYLGQIYKDKNEAKAVDYWIKYLEKSPSGRFAANCTEEIENSSIKLSSEQKKIIAIAFFNSEEYSKSISYLRNVPLKSSWYYLARNNEALGNRGRTLYFYKEGLKQSSEEYEQPENFQYAIQAFVSASSKSREQAWQEALQLTKIGEDYILYNTALTLPKDKRNTYFWQLLKKFPQSDYASDSLWNLFRYYYQTSKDGYDFAIKLGEKHISTYINTKASPAVHFWMGKIYEKRGNRGKAFEYYEKTVSKYPDDYYAFRASGRIKALKTGHDIGWGTNLNNNIPDDISVVNLPYKEYEIIYRYGTFVNELINAGDYETILSMIKYINDDGFLESWVNSQLGSVSRSIVLARNAMEKLEKKPDFNDNKWKLIYPIYFPDKINKNAKSNNLDPAIVISLMKEESYFNTFALSSSNARGLMQLLPGTAYDISRWKELGSYSSIELFDPDVNIKLGTAYLNYVKESLSNNMLFAVAAYNGGPGAVESWIKVYLKGDTDEFIENIPYEQTRTYVKKVYRSYWNYKKLYNLR